MKKLLSISMAALCLLSCAVGCGDTGSGSKSSKKSDSPFVGKWEGKSLKMGDMTMESFFGIPMYAVVHADVNDDGTVVISSPMADLDIEVITSDESDAPQEGTWVAVDKDTIEVTIETEEEDEEDENGNKVKKKEKMSFDLVDDTLVMTEEASEENSLGGSVTLVKVDKYTEIDAEKIEESMKNSLGNFNFGDDDDDDTDDGDDE